MHTEFSVEQLTNPGIARSNEILVRCLQCGYCLDNCPTYQETGHEYDSPRGRVFLIKEMIESQNAPSKETVHYLDRCLNCLSCLSSCPSFVNYMHLMDYAREHIEQNFKRSTRDRLTRWALAKILPYPERLNIAARTAKLAKPIAHALPKSLSQLIDAVPEKIPPASENDQPQVFPAQGKRKFRVALLTGCVQKSINTNINDATIRILRRHGCDVVITEGMGCCGALTYHMGKVQDARTKAINNIQAWMTEIDQHGLDAIIINTSGCGTVVKDYINMFQDHPIAEQAKTISAIAKDICEWLQELNLEYKIKPDIRVAYHASCSLQFGQRIRYVPKKLLKAAGFTVLEPKAQHTCCGSAGTYHLLQPELSKNLKNKKVESIEKLTPDLIAAGNIGCMKQIGSGTNIPVVHSVELLDWATGGPRPENLNDLSDTKVSNT
jgi:glycolate oxidase iron-sulfur subunit